MVVQIAVGIMLGFLFLGVFVLVMCLIGAALVKYQEREPVPEKKPHKRPRPERSRYEEMQRLKRKASVSNPEHWRRT